MFFLFLISLSLSSKLRFLIIINTKYTLNVGMCPKIHIFLLYFSTSFYRETGCFRPHQNIFGGAAQQPRTVERNYIQQPSTFDTCPATASRSQLYTKCHRFGKHQTKPCKADTADSCTTGMQIASKVQSCSATRQSGSL